ncbi:MAG TPA: putative toxin-antitoxin system toxin component, PIN family [Pseudomonadales bacterium]
MRVFLDTNVLVSAVATRGLAGDVVRVVLTEHTLVTGVVVLEELERVLRAKLQLPPPIIKDYLALIREHDVVPRPEMPLRIKLRDPDDKWILASALDGEADVLVTGDQDLLALGDGSPVPIVDPRGFWNLLKTI